MSRDEIFGMGHFAGQSRRVRVDISRGPLLRFSAAYAYFHCSAHRRTIKCLLASILWSWPPTTQQLRLSFPSYYLFHYILFTSFWVDDIHHSLPHSMRFCIGLFPSIFFTSEDILLLFQISIASRILWHFKYFSATSPPPRQSPSVSTLISIFSIFIGQGVPGHTRHSRMQSSLELIFFWLLSEYYISFIGLLQLLSLHTSLFIILFLAI